MNIKRCLGCMRCMIILKNSEHIRVQKDDMNKIYPKIMEADVLVFVSPMYWWGITGELKLAIDRFQTITRHAGVDYLGRKFTALFMICRGGGAQAARMWYAARSQVVGCRDLEYVFGIEKQNVEEARQLETSIK